MYSNAMRSAYGADDNILNTVVADKFDYSPSLNITSEIGDQLGANVRTISPWRYARYRKLHDDERYQLLAQQRSAVDRD